MQNLRTRGDQRWPLKTCGANLFKFIKFEIVKIYLYNYLRQNSVYRMKFGNTNNHVKSRQIGISIFIINKRNDLNNLIVQLYSNIKKKKQLTLEYCNRSTTEKRKLLNTIFSYSMHTMQGSKSNSQYLYNYDKISSLYNVYTIHVSYFLLLCTNINKKEALFKVFPTFL